VLYLALTESVYALEVKATEKFDALPEGKRNAVIDAALFTFGKMGYKKASAKDIADAAGISKGMVFHYFGSKKKLYLYLIGLSWRMLAESFAKGRKPVTDFFDRVLLGTELKLRVIREHPAIFKFITSVYFEKDPEVTPDIREFFKKSEAYRNDFVLTDMDAAKFRDTVKPELVMNILVRFAEGYIGGVPTDDGFDLDAMMKEFTECLDMMRKNFYKEEYL
jgi:AcrR family transcriptional regulator